VNDRIRQQSISVVIGSYNAEAWIQQALDSVLGQTCGVSEILVIDDGSSDATPTIVRSYGGVVRLLTEPHRGRPHRNRGILSSSGEFIAFIDADDWWRPTKIEKQLGLLMAQNADWVVCDSQWLDDETGLLSFPVGEPVRGGDILESLFLNNSIVASTPLVRRRALDDVGYFDESPEVAPVEDWDLWLRLAARYPVACVNEVLTTLRLHGDSFLAATPLERRVRSQEIVLSRAASREPERLGRLIGRALSNVNHAAGVGLFRQQRIVAARRYFLNAWRHQPARFESLAYVLLSLLGMRASMGALRLLRRGDWKIRPERRRAPGSNKGPEATNR
jgi:glycosyltransferase involved in cell wall biosynthesis